MAGTNQTHTQQPSTVAAPMHSTTIAIVPYTEPEL